MRFPVLAKCAAIGGVTLLLILVLSRIDGLVAERRGFQADAEHNVAQSLAGTQTLLGPLLHRQCTEEWEVVLDAKTGTKSTERRETTMLATPQRLTVDGQLQAEGRYRGLFKVNGYSGAMVMKAQWDRLSDLQPTRERKDSRLRCGPLVAFAAVSDVRGIRSAQLAADGHALEVQPGTPHQALGRGLRADLPLERALDGPLALELRIDIVGTSRLGVVPAAQDTRWSLRSDWPHPSFGGRFLPQTREVAAAGFQAQWAVSALASEAAAQVRQGASLCDPAGVPPAQTAADAARGRACLDTMEVSFIDPVNPYVLADRATKYALLFIVLTFAAVALTEVMSRARVHPVQYLLVGLALALFYLLLLSLSEHMPFGAAYLTGSAACVLLLGYYAASMLRHRGRGLAFGSGIALLYGLLWVLLEREQTALAIGSVVLFAALAAVMVLTRRVDWYGLVDTLRKRDEPAPPPAQALASGHEPRVQ